MRNLLYFVIGLVFGYLLSTLTHDGDVIYKTKTVTKTVTKDSLIYKEVIIKETDTLFTTRYIYKDAPVVSGGDSTLIYKDTAEVIQDVKITYTANISGSLNWIKFGFIDYRPEVVRIVEREKTITNTIQPSGFYALAGINTGSEFNIGAAYLKNKFQYQYSLTPKQNSRLKHEIKIGYRIK